MVRFHRGGQAVDVILYVDHRLRCERDAWSDLRRAHLAEALRLEAFARERAEEAAEARVAAAEGAREITESVQLLMNTHTHTRKKSLGSMLSKMPAEEQQVITSNIIPANKP